MALIKTLAEVRNYVKLPKSADVTYMPKFERAETEYLLPVLGETLLTDLQEGYDAATLNASMQILLAKCQAVIAPFAYIQDLPLMQTAITDSGLLSMVAENTQKSWKWEYRNAVDALSSFGYAALENLLIFLKQNAIDFPAWEDSPYNDPQGFAIIRDGAELGKVIGLQHRHRCFMLLRGIFATLAETDIKPLISEEYYAVLTNHILTETLTEQEEIILPKLRMAVARLAIAKATIECNIRFGAQGFTIVDKLVDDPEEGRTNASEHQLKSLRDDMQNTARILLEQVMKYMNANASATVFAEFYTSDQYKDPDAESTAMVNTPSSGTFRMS